MIEATYIDHMGSDLSVVNAARVSFGKVSELENDKLSDKDTRLVRFLSLHKHMSPFGHSFCTWHIKAPVFVARQLVKHKFLRWNEISRRYVDDEPVFYASDVWRGCSIDKKQGSEGQVYPTRDDVLFSNYTALRVYKQLLDEGVCPEQARMVLPLSTMTEWYWSGSLDAFADMCNLRCKLDTQCETRLVASKIDDKMRELFPVSWEALRSNQ
jgi:thymidylate synthase (FAD)|tara:strand:+ start:53 stop:688 length:636 start_codon:yes stop_codon:yes gene_type:complete